MTEPAPWTTIFNRIKTQIPAAPDAVIRQEIWSTMLDFTTDTNIWIEEVPIAVLPNITSYNFTVTHGYPTRLMMAWDNAGDDPARKTHWPQGGMTMRVPGKIELFHKPTAAQSWMIAVAKATSDERFVFVDPPTVPPTPPSPTGYPEVDDWIVNQNNDVIYYGTMYFLQRQPSKPFGNVQAAKENGAIYQSGKSTVRVNQMRANVYNGQAWRFPQDFRTTARKGWV
jgi:hypothetical protein